VWSERLLTMDGEDRIFHLKLDHDILPAYHQTQEGRGSPSTSPGVKPYGLRLDWGRPQAQSTYSSHRAGGSKLSVAQMLVPPASPGQDQRVIGVIHKVSVWANGTSKHRVVDDDPQNLSQNRALRNPALDVPPLLSILARVTNPPVAQAGRDDTNNVGRHLEVFKGFRYPVPVGSIDYV
jgi:hypothetical protein